MTLLLDSNVIIAMAKPESVALQEFLSSQFVCTASVSRVEVLGYHSLSTADKDTFERFFGVTNILSLTDEIVDIAIELRQQRKTALGDAIIAATALVHDLTLATHNTKDFKWIDPLKLIDPLEDQ